MPNDLQGVEPQGGDNFDKVVASVAPASVDRITGPGDSSSKPTSKPSGSMFDKVSAALTTPERTDKGVSPLTGGIVDQTRDPKDYNFNMKYGQDNDYLRAKAQTWYKQLGLSVANLVPNIATTLAGSLGELGTLAQFGDDRTYSNALTETMDKWHNPFGEIYLEHPNQVADLTDSGWWFKQGSSLAEMTGQFALLGGGVGGLLEKGATALGEISGSARIARALLGTSQALTSGALSYTIGAQMGAEVYKRSYQTNYTRLKNLGYTDDEAANQAKHISAQAAASTVQLNTILGFGLNLTSVLPVFKSSDDVVKFLTEGEGKRQLGESLENYKGRLLSYTEKSPEIAHALGISTPGHYAVEATKQAAEGALMNFSQKAGEHQGDEGRITSFFGQFNELSHLFDDITSNQGILNAALGIAGGVLNTAVLDRIPLHKDYIRQNGEAVPIINSDGSPKVDNEGKQEYQTKMYSSRDMARNQRMAYFESNRDAIVTDLDHIQQSKDKLTEIASSGRDTAPEEAQAELNNLLAVQQLHSITMGLSDNLIAEYQDLAKVDNHTDLGEEAQKQVDQVAKQQADILKQAGVQNPDELPEESKPQFQQLEEQRKQLQQQATNLSEVSPAMQKGLTDSMQDSSYVKRAEDAINDMKQYQKWHKNLQTMFSFDSRNAEAHVPETVIHKMIQNHLYNRLITNMSADNALKRGELDAMQGPMIAVGDFNPIVSGYNRKIVQSRQVGDKFNIELGELHKAIKDNDTNKLTDMLAKYKVDYSHDDLGKAAIDLSHKLADLRDQKYAQATQAHENLAKSLEFEQWHTKKGNTDKNLGDYIKELSKRSIENEALNARENYVEQLKAEQSILQDQINKATSNPRKYAASVLKDFNRAKQELTDRIKAENATFIDKEREQKAADNLSIKQKEQATRVYQQKIDDLDKAIASKKRAIAKMVGTETKSKLGKLVSWVRDPRLTSARQELANLEAQRDFFKSNLAKVYTEPTPQTQASNEDLAAVPETIAEKVVKTAASASATSSTQSTPDSVRKTIETEIKNEGIDPITISPESIDAAVVRTLAAEKVAKEPDVPKVAIELDDIIRQTGMPELIRSDIDAILEDPTKFSWDAMNMHIMMGFMDQPMAAKIMSRVHDLITGDAIGTKDAEEFEQEAEEANEPEIVATEETNTPSVNEEPQTPEPDKTELARPDPPSDPPVVGRNVTQGSDPSFHIGAKSTNAAKINTLDINYKDEVDKNGDYVIKSITSQINPKTSEKMLSHGVIKPGTEIHLVVDKEWKGQKKNNSEANSTSADSFSQYVDKNGKIPSVQKLIDEMPVKISTPDGHVLGYLPTVSWVLSKYPNSEDYRNIGEVRDKETGQLISNAETEADKLRAIRAQIAHFFNNGEQKVRTTVTQRNPGHLIMLVDENGKSMTKSAAKVLPDQKLEFGIWENGAIRTSKTTTTAKNMEIANDDDFSSNNAPVAIVPMPGGGYSAAPLYNRSLEPHEINTIKALIEGYLKGDKQMIADVLKHTGFDMSTAEGLRNLINQHYTYTNSFSKSVLEPSIDPEATPRFLFNITNEAGHLKGEISLGTAYSGRPKLTASLGLDGKLNTEFGDALEQGLRGRFKNIVYDDLQRGIKGLNNLQKINEIVYSDGKIKVRKSHATYNDYVRSFSETPVDGTNKLSSGEYVYGVQATAEMSMQDIMENRPDTRPVKVPEGSLPDEVSSTLKSEEATPAKTSSTTESEATKPSFSEDDADLLSGGFMDSMPNFETQGKLLDNLKQLHTFTASENHNGKSPEEVLAELKKLGLTEIPDNFNPFRKC